MENILYDYLLLGKDHILDVDGIDHVLFLITLMAVYSVWDWRKVFLLATAFTIGHSITLALSVFDIVVFPAKIIEYAIPCTIIITCISNLVKGIEKPEDKTLSINYYYALLFGFVHGLGFSNMFKSLMGDSENLAIELLFFNLGIEIGQLIIVLIFLVLGYFLQRIATIKRRDWNIAISSAGIGMSILLILNL